MFYLFIELARPMAWIPGISLMRPALIAAFWGLGAALFTSHRPVPGPLFYMVGMMAVMALNVPFATNNYLAFTGFTTFSTQVLGFSLPLAVLPASVGVVRKLLYAYVFFHVPTAIHGILHQGAGLSGLMIDENDLALALNTALGMAVYLFLETRRTRTKLLLAVTMLLFLSAIVATASRGGFVGLIVLGTYLMLTGTARFKVISLVLVAVLAIFMFAPASFWERMGTISSAPEAGDTGDTRLYLWGIAWQMFLDHPVIGVGTGNFGIRAPEYQDPDRTGWAVHTWGRAAHSIYFTLLSEQGATGTVLFVLIIGWYFKVGRKTIRQAKEDPHDESAHSVSLLSSGLMAAIISYLATGVFLSTLYYPVLWVLVGLMASLVHCHQEERERAEVVEEVSGV